MFPGGAKKSGGLDIDRVALYYEDAKVNMELDHPSGAIKFLDAALRDLKTVRKGAYQDEEKVVVR